MCLLFILLGIPRVSPPIKAEDVFSAPLIIVTLLSQRLDTFRLIYIMSIQSVKKVSNILRNGSRPTHQNKKKSNKHGSGNAYFLRNVHLSIVADDATFGCESTSVTDKVNIEETNTVWARSVPKGRGMYCHGRTSR